ncbi:hypothetical protein GCM10011571_29640 [Marinithermofilum abyssi]|uniref:Uncharacterized protein n=1 Tax=Marinithermofilum abyssi TaxID=1571185 RepID=A0A8J2VHY1_9BACL|nr:hypothetical protein GCM10011571_29640 [Marinithermofilum abyssi]
MGESLHRTTEWRIFLIDFRNYLCNRLDIPDKLLNDQEAKILANKVLKIKPESEVAKKYI